ncbi:hypothetical protein MA16_Dca013622 [Dendrobium catenatum]|uniref:Uncharacterized protein n=1 Tax=Dendrobium catenatum TaxID=906689 RepID=A0A2I0VUV7_9ASPA|nr:hypothetical protein MA16_Dca013622 [Dendrobium catenatum]
MLGIPNQVELSKIREPEGKVKQTCKEVRMGFKQPLLITAGIKPVMPRANRNRNNMAHSEKEVSQLGPIEELPRKRKKEKVDNPGGGDASPLVVNV